MIGEIKMILVVVAASELLAPIAICDSSKPPGSSIVKIDGNAYLLANHPSGDLQAYYVVTGANVSHADMNEWNRTKRLSRAYLDSDEDPVLESDLLANAGLTESHVTEFFRVFKDSAAIFRDFIIEHHDN